MSNSLYFDLQPYGSSSRLTLTANKDLIHESLAQTSENFQKPKRLKHHRLYDLNQANNDMLTWALNAPVVGAIRGQRKRYAAFNDINDFIRHAVILSRNPQPDPKPKIDLETYARDGMDKFQIVANIAKPATDPSVVRHLFRQTLLQMVTELHYPQPGDPETDSIKTVMDNTHYGPSGVTTSLSANSSMGSRPKEWSWTAERFDLAGRNVNNGAEPIILLAGAIAIANAEMLAPA